MNVLVTGALGGIGRAIVDAFENSGFTVFTQDIRDSAETPVDVVGDLLDPSVLGQLRELAVEKHVRHVVAAHGIASSAPVNATSLDVLSRTMRINTLSFIHLYEALNDVLIDGGGNFVAISSQAGLVGEANNGPYCSSKFALVGWAQGRSNTKDTPIRILCPGATETPLLMDALQGMADAEGISLDELIRRRNANTAAGRLGKTSEIGQSAHWLSQLSTRKLVVAAVTGGEVLS